MADSIRLPVPNNTFVQVNSGETFGSIYHISGGDVVYLQASVPPIDYDNTIAVAARSSAGDLLPPYSGLGASNLYAYALNGDAEIGVAPGE